MGLSNWRRKLSKKALDSKERKVSSDLAKDFNKKIKVDGNNYTQSSFDSSRHISTQNEEKGAEAIVTKYEEKIREEIKTENS